MGGLTPLSTMKKDNPSTTPKISRRHFGKISATALASSAFSFSILPSYARGNLTKPTVVGIGIGGKGRTDITRSEEAGFHILGLVDTADSTKMSSMEMEDRRLKSVVETRNQYPDATFFTDYREMYEKLGDKVDAVIVSTPDHHHFHASTMGMQRGKHVYCQKPLTHGIWEARTLARLAKETGVKTQMGNQAHANDHMRRCVELIRAGVIGPVREAHTWTNRPIWPQGFAKPPAKEKVPAWLDWKQWTGPAPSVGYNANIAPFSWRGWWDYGTGALGDMACHIMDMAYWAVDPGSPSQVTAHQAGATKISPPINSKVLWEFPANKYTSKRGFKFNWYDGYLDADFDRETWSLIKHSEEYNHPEAKVLDGMAFQQFGSVVIGENGKLIFNRQRERWVVRTHDGIDGFDWPDQTIARAKDQDPYKEWHDAITGKIDQAESHFGQSGSLTETVLLGVVAQRNPDEKLEWDSGKMEFAGRPDLDSLVKRDYRKGWNLKV